MATAALRFPPLLSSRATPTTTAATFTRRTSSATLRVAAQPESAPASTSTSVSDEPPEFSPPAGFAPPVPRRLAIKEGQLGSIAGAALAVPFRLGTGLFVQGYSVSLVSADKIPADQYSLEFLGLKVRETSKIDQCRRPEKPIEIYEFEGCPFCRKVNIILVYHVCVLYLSFFMYGQPWCFCHVKFQVREMVAVLDLDVLFYPCPQKGPTFRPKVLEMGGKKQFPYMVDPNTGVAMYESDDIIKYLADTYGDGTVPIMLSLGLFTTITAGLAMIWRIWKGSSYTVSKLPPQPIEIWAYE
uniref:GST N-terminal domain-containing protein n=1 Tax=Aegilops tauschii subsp. strangulata TaxID=200361 RepID=A0A453QHG2_AEGTS